MANVSFVLLYVADIASSQKFYADILEKPAIEASPGFTMFEAAAGTRLGLWRADEVEPRATAAGGGEICITVDSEGAVEAKAADWRAKGVALALAPKRMDFGFTFVALDPDGHRLRVFAPAG